MTAVCAGVAGWNRCLREEAAVGLEQASQSGEPCAAPGGLCSHMLMSAYYFEHVVYSGDQRHLPVYKIFVCVASCNGTNSLLYPAVLI